MSRFRVLRSDAERFLGLGFYGAIAISAALLLTTAYLRLAAAPPEFLWRFYLAAENNLAAWWSGALLAAVALLASDGHARLRHVDAGAARAWLVIAALLLFLSADEVGSLHERMAGLGDALKVGTWAFLLPLGALCGVAFLWAAVQLWRFGGAERRRVIGVAVGFGLLGSVAIQEYFEHALSWGGAILQTVRLCVEEGTELAGMLILLRITLGNTVQLLPERRFGFLLEARRELFLGALLLLPVLLVYTLGLPDLGTRGRPIDWLAAVIFLAVAAMVGRRVLSGAATARDLILVLLCGMASAASVALNPQGTVEIGSIVLGSRIAVFGGLAVAMAAILAVRIRKEGVRAAALLATGLTFVLLVPDGKLTAYLFPVFLALVACIVIPRPDREGPPSAMPDLNLAHRTS